MKKKLFGLITLASLLFAMGVEAGQIPTYCVPLQTYAYKKVLCYTGIGGRQQGYIDPGDYVIVEKLYSNGWAYGSYPVKNTRVKRYFKSSDLLANAGFSNQIRYAPTNNTFVYTTTARNKDIGLFGKNEQILVVSSQGDLRQLIYKLNNGSGYKMGWAPYWDCWNADQTVYTATTVFPEYSTPVNNKDPRNYVGQQMANINNSSCYGSGNPFKKSYTDKYNKYHATNCTWYVWGRVKEVLNKNISFRYSSGRDAGKWRSLVTNAYFNSTLTSGCIAERSGHVAYVELVDGGYVYWSEANVNSRTDLKIQKTPIQTFKNKGWWYIHLR